MTTPLVPTMTRMTANQIYWTVKEWILFPEMSAKKSLHALQGCIEDSRDFQILVLRTLMVLRHNALNGKADTWLDTPALYELFSKLNGADSFISSKEDITSMISRIHQWHDSHIDGEMWYCVEDDFLKGIKKALLWRHEQYLKERKERFELWHEDLIATTLHPERVVRMAANYGLDAIDYLEAI